MPSRVLQIVPGISVVPVIHGSGDCAVAVRRIMLEEKFDCLAVPLPPSFQVDVERAIEFLPAISLVTQREGRVAGEWSPDREADEDQAEDVSLSYVPIDPCQPVIAALRIALQERLPRAFIDLETECFEPMTTAFPDPYALRQVSLDKFAAAMLPNLGPLPAGQPRQRVAAMADGLRKLSRKHRSILLVCSILDWPWIVDAWQRQEPRPDDDVVEETLLFQVSRKTLLFALGELPAITAEYEKARSDLEDDENLSVDGVKSLLLATRDRYLADLGKRARKITPQMLSIYLKYVRNLSLIERRMTPDLYTLVEAARDIAGDQFALHLVEAAREYLETPETPFEEITLAIDRARLPHGEIVSLKNRLPGTAVSWRTCKLNRRPLREEQIRWRRQWNPYQQCSWPPEDNVIERFRTHVKDHALGILGQDLARSEKFSTSLMDGLDIRETLRNWHTGDLYVKIAPPSRGTLDCVIMLFDSPADPRDYPWRATWLAEPHDESTLVLFATDFQREIVGPGIGLSTYGGAMFLFPPRYIPDVWTDPRVDFATTLEERLLAAGCLHSRQRHIAVMSALPPGPGWRRLAKRYGKKLVHVPLNHFSQETIAQLRRFHVLNGHQIRSFAADFIRKA